MPANGEEGKVIMKKTVAVILAAVVGLFMLLGMAGADEMLKPYVLASSGPGTIEKKSEEVKASLSQHGFQTVGEYSPYKGVHVIVVTSDLLRNNAAKSDFGTYGVVTRISLTEKKGGEIDVAYTNPLYYAQAYQMKDALADAAVSLEKALGRKSAFGSKKGITANSSFDS